MLFSTLFFILFYFRLPACTEFHYRIGNISIYIIPNGILQNCKALFQIFGSDVQRGLYTQNIFGQRNNQQASFIRSVQNLECPVAIGYVIAVFVLLCHNQCAGHINAPSARDNIGECRTQVSNTFLQQLCIICQNFLKFVRLQIIKCRYAGCTGSMMTAATSSAGR